MYVSSNLNLTQSLNTSNIRNENSNIDISHCSYDQIKPKLIISLSHAYLTVPIETPQLISPCGLIITKTRLGSIIYGNVKNNNDKKSFSCYFKNFNSESENYDELENLMKSYFGMETFGIRHCETFISMEDKHAFETLKNTTKRNGT